MLSSVAFVIVQFDGIPARVPRLVAENDAVAQDSGSLESCALVGGLCLVGADSPSKILFWGDSHAGHLYGALLAMERQGMADRHQLALAVNHSCVPVRTLDHVHRPTHCRQDNDRVYARALQSDVQAVVLSSIWTTYFRERLYDFKTGPNVCAWQGDECRPFADTRSGLAYLERQLGSDLEDLMHAGKRVFIVAPVPVQRMHVPQYLARVLWEGRTPGLLLRREVHEAAQAQMVAALRRIADRVGATLLDPTPLLCSEQICPYQVNGTSIYRDNNHLTTAGARRLVPMFAPVVELP